MALKFPGAYVAMLAHRIGEAKLDFYQSLDQMQIKRLATEIERSRNIERTPFTRKRIEY